MKHHAAALAVLVLAGGCKSRVTPDGAGGATRPATSATASPATSTAPVASMTTPDSTAPRPKGAPNLLDLVPAELAVSSAVVNPRDFPEHMIDGRQDTAWNSKTGDLKGWIDFRVPKDAHVQSIQMTTGFDKQRPDLDLFTANHRIVKVDILRDGKKLKEARLDPQQRGLQTIDVDGPGGEYRVQVTETLPGTKPEWKELVVSEVRVLGTPGKERRKPSDHLRVAVGSLDAPISFLITDVSAPIEPAPDLAAICAKYVTETTAATARVPLEPGEVRGPITCAETAKPAAFKPSPPYRGVHAVVVSDGMAKATRLVLETTRGFFFTEIEWDREDPKDPGCPSIVRLYALDTARVDNGYFVAVLRGSWQRYEQTETEGTYRSVTVNGAAWGRDDGKGLVLKRYHPQFSESLGDFHITPAGELQPQG